MNPLDEHDAHIQAELTEILRQNRISSEFQPVVDLNSGSVIGYEALARGPVGPLHRPNHLFQAAWSTGRLAELDEACRRAALANGIEAGIVAPLTLFVNVEPAVLDTAPLQELVDLAEAAPGGLQVVLEITERAIATRPAELLATVSRLRAAGWRIALDDVGADDMSLAFMPLLRPDIVKLDLSLVQRRPGPAIAEIMHAVNAYAERTGALLLAEGIEDEKHLATARSLGATLGQGWMFGRPAPGLSTSLPTSILDLPAPRVTSCAGSPFECLPESVPLRRSTKPLLLEISKFLEREALRFGPTGMVIAAFQKARNLTPSTLQRYRELADKVGFVVALGQGFGSEPIRGLRGADLDPDDPVRQQWNIVVLAPHFAAALIAHDLGRVDPTGARLFDFALTYDRDTVSAAAESLLSRVRAHDQGHDKAATSPPRRKPASAPRLAAPAAVAPAGDWSETTLRRALSATRNGISIVDITRPDHPLVYVNTAFERLSGLRAEYVLGRNCRLLQGPETDPSAILRLREAIRDGREARETILNYRHPHRTPWWNEIYLAPVFDEHGRLVQYIGIQNDVTTAVQDRAQLEAERKRSAAYVAEIETLAFRDPLTGLANRRRLPEVVESAVLQAQLDGLGLALLYLDIDHFKAINDEYGHATGDAVLQAVAQRLEASLRRGDLVARLGGDEFLILLPGLDIANAAAEAAQVAAECLGDLKLPITTPQGTQLTMIASIGTSTYPTDGQTFDRLVHAADRRMYASKHSAVDRRRTRGRISGMKHSD